MFLNTRNGAWYFHFFRACFNFVSKRFETTETFGLSQFSSCFSPFQFFPYIIHCFSVSKHQKWGLVFSLFQSLFQFCFETTETFGLSQFSSCFSPFQFFPYIIHCFSVSKHQKWGLVFSIFPELVSILFRNISKQLKRLDLVNFLPVSVRFSFSLYNPLFQCFETPEMGPGIFTRACFNFVSKRFETTETFGLSQFSSCFSPFQFFPYIIHCFSVSKHQKWGLVFSPFSELVSILFRNVSKQLKHLDLVSFLPVSVHFSFFPI